MNFLTYRFRQIKKLPGWIFFLAAKILLGWRHLMRVELIDEEQTLAARKTPAIGLLWHNRLLFLPTLFGRWDREHTVAVISASRDGEYIADLCRCFGVESVRGSTKRGAVKVQLAANRVIQSGKYIIYTPDGPRGPKYHVSPGPVRMASDTGTRIVPMAINYSAYWELKSWDNFQIPKPWAKITLHLGHSFTVPPGITKAELNEWCREAERRMLAITVDKPKGKR